MRLRTILRSPFSSRYAYAILGSLAAALATQLLVLVTGILASRVLGPEPRGYLALVIFVPSLVATVVAFGIPAATTYFTSFPLTDSQSVLNSSFKIYLIQTAIAASVQFALLLTIFNDYPQAFRTAFLLALPSSAALLMQSYSLALLQGRQDFRKLNIYRMLPQAVYALLLVSVCALGIGSLLNIALCWILGTIAGSATTLAILAMSGSDEFRPPSGRDATSVADLARFGARAFLGTSSPIESLRLDQGIVAALLGPTALGIYVAALGFSNFPRFIGQSFGQVAFPALAASPSSADARRKVLWFAVLTTALSAISIAPVLLLSNYLVGMLLGEQFVDAVPIIHITLFTSLFFSLRRVLSDSLAGMGHPADGAVAELIACGVLIIMLPFLSSRYELSGIAVAILLAAATGVMWLCVRIRIATRATRPLCAASANPSANALHSELPIQPETNVEPTLSVPNLQRQPADRHLSQNTRG